MTKSQIYQGSKVGLNGKQTANFKGVPYIKMIATPLKSAVYLPFRPTGSKYSVTSRCVIAQAVLQEMVEVFHSVRCSN
ncbi:MAG: hypothetical protein EZS28_048908, partial [Streblomastix strix]